ncbi:hypothetical protein ABI59_22735 [Acidobacteria bacterium Mor1]|nr:hypothetical protein ABI59_22735 [Acidobacteria bacterium Mor1]
MGVSGRPRIGREVFLLGLVSLLTDAASEMALPLLPAFLTLTLGAGAATLGLIEGIAEATASILKLVSGRLADRSGRRRPLVLAGYGLSSLVRPLLALAVLPVHVLAVRFTDRIGKGLRSSPRDAMIAAVTPVEQRAAAFGFHRAMDHAGAVIGPLLAVAVLTLWTDDLRLVFALSAIPGALAVAVLLLGVREPEAAIPAAKQRAASADMNVGERRALGGFLVPLSLFTLGNASDAFLLLRAGGETSLYTLPLLWMAMHGVKAVASLFGGRFADIVGRRKVIALGWFVHALVYAAFAFVSDLWAIWGLFLVYGAHRGLTGGAERALVSTLVSADRAGTGFGWYHLTVGLLTLAANVLFGVLWSRFDSHVAFLSSSLLALIATATLIAVRLPKTYKKDD